MLYPIDETAKAVGLAPQTVRNWIASGVLPVPNHRPGKGAKIGLSRFEVIVVLVAAELSHVGIGPKSFSPIVPQLAYNVKMIAEYLQGAEQGAYFIQSGHEPVHMAEMVEQNSFFAIYYDPSAENGFSCIAAKPGDTLETVDTTKVVVDALHLHFKADSILKTLPQME